MSRLRRCSWRLGSPGQDHREGLTTWIQRIPSGSVVSSAGIDAIGVGHPCGSRCRSTDRGPSRDRRLRFATRSRGAATGAGRTARPGGERNPSPGPARRSLRSIPMASWTAIAGTLGNSRRSSDSATREVSGFLCRGHALHCRQADGQTASEQPMNTPRARSVTLRSNERRAVWLPHLAVRPERRGAWCHTPDEVT